MLDSLEKTSSRLAQAINAPPIDVPRLRKEWTEIRLQARGLKPVDLPSVLAIRRTPLEVLSARLSGHCPFLYVKAMQAEMGRQVAVALYVVAMAAVIVGVDFAFFRNRFWERLAVNIGIVLVFAAFYLRFLRRP